MEVVVLEHWFVDSLEHCYTQPICLKLLIMEFFLVISQARQENQEENKRCDI